MLVVHNEIIHVIGITLLFSEHFFVKYSFGSKVNKCWKITQRSTDRRVVLPVEILLFPVPVQDPAATTAERASSDETVAVESSPF